MGMNEEYSIIWDNFINQLKNRIAIVSINSWFKNCRIHKIEDINNNGKEVKLIVIEVTSTFIMEELKKRYVDTIIELMESILGKQCMIDFILKDDAIKEKTESIPVTEVTQETIDIVPKTEPVIVDNSFESNILDTGTLNVEPIPAPINNETIHTINNSDIN